MKLHRVTLLPVIVLLISLPLYSHHYILVPDKFMYEPGDSIHVHLMVGEPFDFEFERELQHSMTTHFMLYTNMDSMNLLKLMPDNSKTILNTKANFNGLALIEMQRTSSFVEQTPSAFQKYLLEEKINGIKFDSSRWMKSIVKEKYSRCIKSLVVCGKNDQDHLWNKVVGQRLELVLKANPYELKDKEPIAVKLFWNGKPLPGEWITATIRTQEGNIKEQSAVTDGEGVTVFEVERNAIYYLHVVHMIKLSNESDADFESVWASYSFLVPGERR